MPASHRARKPSRKPVTKAAAKRAMPRIAAPTRTSVPALRDAPPGCDFADLPCGSVFHYHEAWRRGFDEVWTKVSTTEYGDPARGLVFPHPTGCPVLPAMAGTQ